MCLSVVVLAQAPTAGTKTDPLLGTWKLNPEKSTPKPPPGTVSVRQYHCVQMGSWLRPLSVLILRGIPTFQSDTWKYDGKDYPQYTQVSLPEFSAKGVKPGTTAYRAVDAYTTELIQKDNSGKALTGTRTRVVSKDGKTLTDTLKGTDARGQAVNTVAVFDKVQ